MSSKNAVESILVLSHSSIYCKYVINNGEQQLCSYEKIRNLLMEIVPTLALNIEYFLERKLSFFIVVNELTIKEVTLDLEFAIEKLKKDKNELNFKTLNAYLSSEKNSEMAPRYQKQIINLQRKFKWN